MCYCTCRASQGWSYHIARFHSPICLLDHPFFLMSNVWVVLYMEHLCSMESEHGNKHWRWTCLIYVHIWCWFVVHICIYMYVSIWQYIILIYIYMYCIHDCIWLHIILDSLSCINNIIVQLSIYIIKETLAYRMCGC